MARKLYAKLGMCALGFLWLFAEQSYAQIGSIDVPQFEDVEQGNSGFAGWAMDSGAPITAVVILVDGASYGSAIYGENRADACNAIGNWPGCPNVGWSFSLNTNQLTNGEHVLTVALSAANGGQSTLVSAFVVDNANQGLLPTTDYRIANLATGGVLDVTNYGISNGTNIQQWQYLGGPNQLWQAVVTENGNWVFESLNSSKALTVPFGSSANGTQVEQVEYYGSPYQEWTLVGAGNQSFAFYNVATGKALDLQGGSAANGTPIQIWDYLAGTNQHWLLIPETSPPGGLFGEGGEPVGSSSPQIPSGDILSSVEQPPPATAYAGGANGPTCNNIAEMVGLSIASQPLDSYGNIDLLYAYTDPTGLHWKVPPPGVKRAFDWGFQQWNNYTTTTHVNFQVTGTKSASTANITVAKGNNEQSDYCVQYISDKIFWGATFQTVAQNNLTTAHPTVPDGEAAHEIGHSVGLNEAGSNPQTPTVMNQASGNRIDLLCANPTGAPQRTPTPNDAAAANTCVNTARRRVANGDYGDLAVIYSTVTFPNDSCTYYFNTVNWLLDDSADGSSYSFASADCN